MMNRTVFGAHLVKVLEMAGIDARNSYYVIYPVFEEGKKYNSKDDFVRLNVFPEGKISNYKFTFDEILQRFSVFEPYYPLWVNVCIKDGDVIELYTSLRFRKPSEVLKSGTGMEPFKLVEE